VLIENVQNEDGGEDNTDSGPVASNGKERGRARLSDRTETKEGNTPIFDTTLSSTTGGGGRL